MSSTRSRISDIPAGWPVQVMQHMSKCFQAIGKLKLDTETPAAGQRPRGLGMVSCVGEEYVPFKSALPLVDKVTRAALSSVLGA